MTRLLQGSLGLLVLTLMMQGSAQLHDSEDPPKYDCGVKALYFLLDLEGRRSSLPEVAGPGAGDPAGRTPAELRELARRRGLDLEGVRLRGGSGSLDRPAIAFIRVDGHGHYIVLRPVGPSGRMIQVLDPNREPYLLDATELDAEPGWTGIALIPRRRDWNFGLVRSSLVVVCGICLLLAVRGLRRWARSRSMSMTESYPPLPAPNPGRVKLGPPGARVG